MYDGVFLLRIKQPFVTWVYIMRLLWTLYGQFFFFKFIWVERNALILITSSQNFSQNSFNCSIDILLLNRCYLCESRLYSWRKYCCIQYSVVTRIQHDLYKLIADILDCYCKRVVYELCELLHHFAELQYIEWLFSYGVWQKMRHIAALQ